MDRSVDGSLGVGESRVESADKGRGLEAEEEEEEAAGLGCAILEMVCYCCAQEGQGISVLERSWENCTGQNDNLYQA
jgi:hypothetical protein